MRTVRRLRLRFLCLRPGTPNPTASTLPSAIIPTLCPVETMQAHYEVYSRFLCLCWLCANRIYLMVDLGGFAPPSRTLFLITVYAVLVIIYLFLKVVNLFGA